MTTAQRQDLIFFSLLIITLFSIPLFLASLSVLEKTITYRTCREANNAVVYCVGYTGYTSVGLKPPLNAID